jgi:hypothetical protein
LIALLANELETKSKFSEESRQHFVSCLQMKADNKASIMHCERIDHYIEEFPGQQWNGVYTFKHK